MCYYILKRKSVSRQRIRVNLQSEASGLSVNVEEIEANYFAANLLMPHSSIEADPRAALVDVEASQAVEELADRYRVSPRAMSIRLGDLAARRS
jgi:Zn-dependent peptidase ImmA (M78 family)